MGDTFKLFQGRFPATIDRTACLSGAGTFLTATPWSFSTTFSGTSFAVFADSEHVLKRRLCDKYLTCRTDCLCHSGVLSLT